MKIVAGEKHSVVLIIESSVVEVYVDDKIAMGARMFDFRGKWGIYSHGTIAEFLSIKMEKEKL